MPQNSPRISPSIQSRNDLRTNSSNLYDNTHNVNGTSSLHSVKPVSILDFNNNKNSIPKTTAQRLSKEGGALVLPLNTQGTQQHPHPYNRGSQLKPALLNSCQKLQHQCLSILNGIDISNRSRETFSKYSSDYDDSGTQATSMNHSRKNDVSYS